MTKNVKGEEEPRRDGDGWEERKGRVEGSGEENIKRGKEKEKKGKGTILIES